MNESSGDELTMAEKIKTEEAKKYPPSQEVIDKAWIKDWEAKRLEVGKDWTATENFWAKEAEDLVWEKKWDKICDQSEKPFFKWFTGATTNIVANAVDRHYKERPDKIAFYWVPEDPNAPIKEITYKILYEEVNKFANAFKKLGLKKGDIVTIYMPRIPEQFYVMLACTKLGAMHSVIYAGFSSAAIADRIHDAESPFLITTDGYPYRGKPIDSKKVCDDAAEQCPTIKNLIVVKHAGNDVNWVEGRDLWYRDIVEKESTECPTEMVDSETPLFILYTSGTTGKPKGIQHHHGGYQVGVQTTLKYCFDLKDEDVWFCTADPGWITGHSYIVYGPLILGTTSMFYEGAFNFPDWGRWWQLVQDYKITVFYTAPTAIRALMAQGTEWPDKYDLSSLRILGTVGEPINPAAWEWYHESIGKNKCPIIDTWWQTETGNFTITPGPTQVLKPGSATKAFFGVHAMVVDEDGKEVAPNTEGYLVITTPWPGMLRTLYKDPDRYMNQYWAKYEGRYYVTGDAAKMDDDGYIWIIGRTDDVIKVSGHRLGTAEIESAIVSHPKVAEAACIGLPHEMKGNAIKAFVVIVSSAEKSEELAQEIRQHVRNRLGPIARPDWVEIVDGLPKTRSGKIMRRLLKARELGQDIGDTSTLQD
ncbi:MAG: acetate--CoA ligase [Candidatus Hodarchaeales archaeon]|jgi:acetyl-CoA synthetase